MNQPVEQSWRAIPYEHQARILKTIAEALAGGRAELGEDGVATGPFRLLVRENGTLRLEVRGIVYGIEPRLHELANLVVDLWNAERLAPEEVTLAG